jgi:CubicO group peptidase (beta-lactamase class C family)
MTTSGIGASPLARQQAIGYSRSISGELVHARPCKATFGFGAEAAFSTAHDLYLLDRALWSGRLLSDAGRLRMLTPRIATHKGSEYGYGWFIGKLFGRTAVSALGGTAGFMASLQHFIEDDVVLVVVLNHDFALDVELYQQLAAIALGEAWRPLLSQPQVQTQQAIASWAGVYDMQGGRHLRLRPDNGRLLLEEEALDRSFQVHPISVDVGYVKEQNARLSFHRPDDGGPIQLQVLYGVRLWHGHRVRCTLNLPGFQSAQPDARDGVTV